MRRVLLDTFLRRQLASGAVPSERVSLIKIQPEEAKTPAMPFALFPLDASLAAHITAALDEPRSHGPYLPALRMMNKLLALSARHLKPIARISVLFLSDGKPSDRIDEGVLRKQIQEELRKVGELTRRPAPSLEQFQLLGFGEAHEGTLRMMADAVPGRLATCEIVRGTDGYTSLAQSVSTFSSSVTVSRISSVSAVAHNKPLRRVNRFVTGGSLMDLYPECEIELPPKKLGDFLGALQPLRGLHDVYIASTMLGHGGERNAYLMRFARDNNFTSSDEEWVVKESRHERDELQEHEFHKKALVTQRTAEELAQRFNEEAVSLGLVGLPKVSYMTSCFLTTGRMERRDGRPADPDEPESRYLFAERKIDGDFRKWNTNFGATVQTADAVLDDDEGHGGGGGGGGAADDGAEVTRLNSDLVPQAFSHFTCCYSERPLSNFVGPSGKRGRCLVCDLQGCYNKKENTFLLSDPVIHSDLGVNHLFGLTDNGAKGIDLFLRSHKCNDVCRMLKLPDNKDFVAENVGQLENSSVNTSFVSIVHTVHLRERQHQRYIADRELQAAKKHGLKVRMPNGSIKHKHGGLHYVTDKAQQVGVTGFWRDSDAAWPHHDQPGAAAPPPPYPPPYPPPPYPPPPYPPPYPPQHPHPQYALGNHPAAQGPPPPPPPPFYPPPPANGGPVPLEVLQRLETEAIARRDFAGARRYRLEMDAHSARGAAPADATAPPPRSIWLPPGAAAADAARRSRRTTRQCTRQWEVALDPAIPNISTTSTTSTTRSSGSSNSAPRRRPRWCRS